MQTFAKREVILTKEIFLDSKSLLVFSTVTNKPDAISLSCRLFTCKTGNNKVYMSLFANDVPRPIVTLIRNFRPGLILPFSMFGLLRLKSFSFNVKNCSSMLLRNILSRQIYHSDGVSEPAPRGRRNSVPCGRKCNLFTRGKIIFCCMVYISSCINRNL